jgi:NADH dehydrogenase
MDLRFVTVFGGTGFLGRRVVRRLRGQGFGVRIAVRRPARAQDLFGRDDPHIEAVPADVNDGPSVASALADAYGAVNAVSLYVERGGATFQSVHVVAARQVASRARLAQVERLVHVSGVGADPASPSLYVRKRGEGEHAVRDAFPGAVLMRPTVMFGPDDAFLSRLIELLRRFPVFPLFGRGETRLQPAYVEDVAEAVARILRRADQRGPTFECGGPVVYRYRELIRAIAGATGRHPLLLPVPFLAWRALARVLELSPTSPITVNQVELMQFDSIASPRLPGFANLDITPEPLESVLRRISSPV